MDDLRIALGYLISGLAVLPKSISVGAVEPLLHSNCLRSEAESGSLKVGLVS